MRTRYGISPWIHDFPSSRRPDFPRFRGDVSAANVVIVGGGLVGCATAYAFATAGLRPVVLEAGRVGQHAAGRGAGLLLPEPGPPFRDLVAEHGVRASRRMFEAWRGGTLEAAALIRRLGIKCGLTPLNMLLVADRHDDKAVRREQAAREEAGLEVTGLAQKQVKKTVNLDASAALRLRDGFSLDPYRLCVGLAAAAVKRRAAFFERSPVTKIRHGRKDVEITLGNTIIRAATVVIATGTATPVFKPLRRHFKRREMYFTLTEPLPGGMRKQLGDPTVTIRDMRVPPRRLRWTADGRLVVWGGDQGETPARTRDTVLVQRTGDLMYGLLTMYPVISGLHPEFGWEASYGPAADGLMYIGPHRNYPHHLFALGRTPDSATGAFVAARLLLRAIQGQPEKTDAVFGWTR